MKEGVNVLGVHYKRRVKASKIRLAEQFPGCCSPKEEVVKAVAQEASEGFARVRTGLV